MIRNKIAEYRPDGQIGTALVVGAVRCWVEAGSVARSRQPALSHLPALRDIPLLSPVLDSLLRFYEAALGRPIHAGEAGQVSRDEQTLLALLGADQPDLRCLTCPARKAEDLRCALCTTRIMLDMTAVEPGPSLQ